MVKIIREGQKMDQPHLPLRAEFECLGCGCVFEAERADMESDCLYSGVCIVEQTIYCRCPNCGDRVQIRDVLEDEWP